MKKIYLSLTIIAAAIVIIILVLLFQKQASVNHFDFVAGFMNAEKKGFDESEDISVYLPDSLYSFDHSFIRKVFAEIFSSGTFSLVENGMQKSSYSGNLKDAALRLVFPFQKNDRWKFTFNIKIQPNGDKRVITAESGLGKCLITLSDVVAGKNHTIDSFEYKLMENEGNVITLAFFNDYLLIFSREDILYQEKSASLDRTGGIGFALEKAEAANKAYGLRLAKMKENQKDSVLGNLTARHKVIRNHRFNIGTEAWNELYSRKSVIINGRKSPFLQRIKFGVHTKPAILMKMNSELRYTLRIPKNASLDFCVSVVPEYVSEIGRLSLNVEIVDSSGKIEEKQSVSFAQFTDPYKTFNPVKMNLADFSEEEKTIVFRTSTIDGKCKDNENKIIFALSAPSIYLAADDPGPNVILISLDALKQDHLGCYGYSRDTSPNIDKLASESAVFKNAITAANWTIPSHMTIMTGLYPLEAGFFPEGLLNAKSFIAENVITLAEYLRQKGYYTLGVHGGGYMSEFYGFDKGFNSYIEGSKDSADGIQKIIENLGQFKENKFFIFFHTLEIHWPYLRDYYLQSLPASSPVKDRVIAKYDSGVKNADAQLGRLFDWMKSNGLFENTIIIILSDHGETFRMVNETAKSGSHGSTLFDDEIKIPFIVRIPGISYNGKKIEYQAATVDIVPTILDCLGIEPANELRGISLLPLIKGKETPKPRLAYSEATHSTRLFQSVRSNEYKLLTESSSITNMLSGGNKRQILYDLKADPGETRNYIREKRQIADIYSSFMNRLLESIRSRMTALKQSEQEPAGGNKELEKQLRGLGYVGN